MWKASDQFIKIEYVAMKDHILNILTKPLPRYNFECLRKRMGVSFFPS